MRYIAVYLIGAIFGLGISVSGMANPAKVLNFFDVAGTFDFSLALVMVGALAVAIPGYALIFRKRRGPVFAKGFSLPTATQVDGKLVGGSATFGIGWGIAGFCPGAAIPALGLGHVTAFIFVAALLAGILIARVLLQTDLFAKVTRPLQGH